MSGIIGHMTYAVLAGKAARERKLPIAPFIHRHYASYLCGSYLGCDIGTLPAAICVETGQEVGYGPMTLQRSPLTGGPVRPYTLSVDGATYTPKQINSDFYGRSHLVFGWSSRDVEHTLPWEHLPDYLALVVDDAIELFGPGKRKLAYLFGWMTHVVGDALIKSVRPGIELDLLNGKYTPQNRPIQDLYSFHEVGVKELGLAWRDLMADLVDTPVEPVQAHYMRLAPRRGKLGRDFPDAWQPGRQKLLLTVMAENRRYQRIRNRRLLEQLRLTRTRAGWQCSKELSEKTGGLTYSEMVELAEKANFRHALWQMGEAIADLFEQVIDRQPVLEKLPPTDGPTWAELTTRWRRK